MRYCKNGHRDRGGGGGGGGGIGPTVHRIISTGATRKFQRHDDRAGS